jgi:hypothetical protein
VSKPFDATLKHLLETYPHDWLRCLGLEPRGRVEVISADLATVTTEADKVFHIRTADPWRLHLELQGERRPGPRPASAAV